MAYNVPFVTLRTARETAVAYIRAGIIPCLVSAPGVGKTTMVRLIADTLGAQIRPIRLNNIPSEDVVGLQYIDREGGRSTHLPPKWMPAPDGSDGPVLVFIDEISQASDENRKAIMSALLERYLGDTALPDNCWFIAAGNSAEDGTNVYEMDRATADRFGIIKIRPDVEDFCNEYAREHEVDMGVVSFLRIRPDAFEMSKEMSNTDDVVGTSPRTWVAVSRFLKVADGCGLPQEAVEAGVMGKTGQQIGTAFLSVRKEVHQLKSVAALIAMKPEERRRHAPRTIEALWTYCQGMIWHATDLNRVVEVFELLESFEDVEDVPFQETRFTVAETVLKRAVDLHRIDGVFENERMQKLIVKWRREIDDIAGGVPSAEDHTAEAIGIRLAA